MKLLSILTVTKAESYTDYFLTKMQELANTANAELVIAGDGTESINRLRSQGYGEDEVLVSVKSTGYIESVLDAAVRCCSGKYILRLDDDECVSPEMFRWIVNQSFTEADHWKFSRANLWHRPNLYITNPPLWPDHQTRLSIRKKSGGRTTVHAGSPFGGGKLAPVVLEHWKFLVKNVDERRTIAKRYDSVVEGYGTGGMLPFSLPEEAYSRMELRDIKEAATQAVLDSEKDALGVL